MSHIGFQGLSSIAVALDGSPLSNSALPMAKGLARAFHSRLLLVSILDDAVNERFAEFATAEGMDLLEAVRAYQDKIISDLREEGLPAAGHVLPLREGTTADAIRKVIENLSASLLIVGSQSRSGMKRVVLGSVAQELIRGGHVPVLVVKPSAAEALASA